MRLIDRARAKGIEIYCDQYCQPYAREANLGSWFTSYLMGEEMRAPPSVDELVKDMKNLEKWEEIKKKAIESYEKDVEKNEERRKALGKRGIKVPAIWNPATFDYIVYSETRPDLVGKNFTEVAEAMGIEDFWNAIRDLYLADDGNTYVAAGGMCEEDVITIRSIQLRRFQQTIGLWTGPRQCVILVYFRIQEATVSTQRFWGDMYVT